MHAYIIRRLLYMVPMLLGISALSFFVIHLAPGDFLTDLQLNPQISRETVEQMRRHYGLHLPLWRQYLLWLSRVVLHGDLGMSFQFHAPVSHIILSRAWNTILLSVSSMVLAWGIALPLGIYAARRHQSWVDKTLTGLSFVGISIPNFFLALCLLYLIVLYQVPLPIGGAISVDYAELSFWGKVADRAKHLIIPVFVLVTASIAGLSRYMRGSMLDQLRQDYVTVARAKGLTENRVVYRHAARNAINPLITIFGFDLGSILGGAALTEIVTGYPGLGSVMLQAVRAMDYHLVMGSLLIGGVLLILGNLTADIMLAWADPRVRYD